MSSFGDETWMGRQFLHMHFEQRIKTFIVNSLLHYVTSILTRLAAQRVHVYQTRSVSSSLCSISWSLPFQTNVLKSLTFLGQQNSKAPKINPIYIYRNTVSRTHHIINFVHRTVITMSQPYSLPSTFIQCFCCTFPNYKTKLTSDLLFDSSTTSLHC